ncbi:4Fe-4S dicluster domain-containing protein [uncultured Megasphaera sp.]|uniref:4Fe-4S dicluster domain-containing protein n=1 Tax=uncultured Megasphaera sp. TaxID=165188 RepID=UPI00265ADA2B|nr:4Fe-4S dicluster domain-containing protein [uncultured Megasphaera sp.]
MAKMSVDDKLGVVKFVTDEHESHIEINEDYHDEAEIRRLVMACPAELYKYTDGKLVFNHEGCLECGTCRVISIGKGVKSWTHPKGAMGVEYHHG